MHGTNNIQLDKPCLSRLLTQRKVGEGQSYKTKPQTRMQQPYIMKYGGARNICDGAWALGS